jgi:hypothetical protein
MLCVTTWSLEFWISNPGFEMKFAHGGYGKPPSVFGWGWVAEPDYLPAVSRPLRAVDWLLLPRLFGVGVAVGAIASQIEEQT